MKKRVLTKKLMCVLLSLSVAFCAAQPFCAAASDLRDDDNTVVFDETADFDGTVEMTEEQTAAVNNFLADFNKAYISENSTDYEKVKTIYDFIVRNTEYDYDVFEGKYDSSSERYQRAHTAFGALYGNLGSTDDFDLTSQSAPDGQPVPAAANQGLSVCEGFSALFKMMCESNGIECICVRGDYTDSSRTDPHQWNYVFLDGEWYQVDTTFASQQSVKEVQYNCYDYFLRGSESEYFASSVHQQVYTDSKYDGWVDASKYPLSPDDYSFPTPDLDAVMAQSSSVIMIRSYSVNGQNYASYLLAGDESISKILVDENDNIYFENVTGFSYNGKSNSTYTVILPYTVNGSAVFDGSSMLSVGTYTVDVFGKEVDIVVAPMDMSKRSDGKNYIKSPDSMGTRTYYCGEVIQPNIEIVDGFGNALTAGTDYTVEIYDSAKTEKKTLKDIGTYLINVSYKGNYTGSYSFGFTIDKILLSSLGIDSQQYQYLPVNLRKKLGITDIKSYYSYGTKNSPLKVGDYELVEDTDYTVSASGGMDYGDSGTITLTGKSGSSKVVASDSKKIPHAVSKKYSISSLGIDGKAASSTAYTYTGSAIKPSSLSNLDSVLVSGSEYKITGYSSNVSAGKGWVSVAGINGCSGTATMYFVIQPASITKADIDAKVKNNVFSYKAVYNGESLKKGTDYSESISFSGTTCTVKLTGKGNFNGSYSMKIKNMPPPSSSGNKITLSSKSFVYSGKSKKPTVTVKNKSGAVVNPFLYTVSYSDNKKVGKAKVTVKFKTGGSVSASYKIVPKNTSISKLTAGKKKFTVKLKKYTTQTTGYQIQYSTSSKFKSAKTVTIKNSTTSKTIKKLKSKKKYFVRVRTYKTVGKTKYYSSWSKAKTVKTK